MAWARVAAFVLALVALFVWAGEVVSRASGTGRRVAVAEGVSVENGEAVFWGPGKCHTCHAVGPRGTAVRGPNLGASADGPEIAVRAAERAAARSEATGRTMTPTDYLVESLTSPSAHLVPGYKDEMPEIHRPPIALGPDEIESVILYLQTVGGEPDPGAIRLPPEVLARADGSVPGPADDPWAGGDPERGRALFFDEAGPAACARCHRVDGEGGEIGPELTEIAGTRTVGFIVESMLDPAARIAGGYETSLVETADGRILEGLVVRETADSVWLAEATGETRALGRGEIVRSRAQDTSIMPENLAELLTARDLLDLIAFLRTLR